MNKDILIVADTRQQKDGHITKYFDRHKIQWIRDNLQSADYMRILWKDGFVKDYSILIDTKKDLVELAHNLCNTQEHARVVREIEKAKELGCEKFYFLIAEYKVKTLDDLKSWSSPYTKVKGETLLKIMTTFSKNHEVKFLIVPKKEMGAKVYSILTQ